MGARKGNREKKLEAKPAKGARATAETTLIGHVSSLVQTPRPKKSGG